MEGTMQNTTNVVTMSENRMAALKQRATQQQGEVWQPSAGDTLFGMIAGSEATHHPIYGQQRLMLVQSDSGAIVKVWMSKSLPIGHYDGC